MKKTSIGIIISSVFLILLMLIVPKDKITTMSPRTQGLRINEICSSNYQAYHDENTGYSDYIELYNPTNQDIILDDYYLTQNLVNHSDSLSSGNELTGLTISAHDYLIVTTGEKGNVSFSLNAEKNGCIYLLRSNQKDIIAIDQMSYPSLRYDTSYGVSELDGSMTYAVIEPSPGYENSSPLKGYQKTPSSPSFSLESGFYQMPRQLTLLADSGCQIYYTVDGSEPTSENSILYTGPISLSEILKRETLYASRTDVSTGFLTEEILSRGLTDPGYQIPDDVDKAVIIRAISVDKEGNYSPSVTKTFFSAEIKDAYPNLSILSITADPDDLFGMEKGIYSMGNTFYEDPSSAMYQTDWCWWMANYHQTGRQWERPAHIDYFTKNKFLATSQSVGLRIAGGSSRGYNQKSLKLFSRKALSGKSYFSYDFFGDYSRLKSLLLSSGGNDENSHMKDYLAQSFLSEQPFATVDMIPCAVFLNGEYWGFYFLTQNYDSVYIEQYYDVPAEDVIIFRNGNLSVGIPSDQTTYDDLLAFIEKTDFSKSENYEKLCTMMDMDSYIHYYAAQLYMSRRKDWPGSNVAIWRSRDSGDSSNPYADGRWRYMLFDTNTLYGELDAPDSTAFENCIEKDFLFSKVLANKAFCREFRNVILEMADNVFEISAIDTWIDNYTANYGMAILQNYERFYGDSKDPQSYFGTSEQIRSFFHERKKYLLEELDKYVPVE